MRSLGMRYCDRKKNFYVDGHERKDVVMSRWKFIRKYLCREIRMHRWTQITEEEAELLNKSNAVDISTGWHYIDSKTSKDMYEFHVDVHETFQSKFENHEYGGNLSIRKDPESKIILSFGHDEAIFNMMAFTSRCWSGTHGEQPIVPKDNGTGIMYSCFQSREFGFGYRTLSDDDLQRINDCRRGANRFYLDQNAAKIVFKDYSRGSSKISKTEFTVDDNPFVKEFRYGINDDGYWTYDHFIIQLEDCMDILNILHPPDKFEVQILVDHSCGHDRQRTDGLNVVCMNSMYGGKQRRIHDTRIVQGCIGDFKSTLELGDIQNMQFNLMDTGPFYLPDNERLKLKEGDLSTSKFASINKNMLLKQLFDLNIFPEHGSFDILSETFTVDFRNKTLIGADKQVPRDKLLSICDRQKLDYDAISTPTDLILINLLLSKIPGDSFKHGNQTIHIERQHKKLWMRNNVITANKVRYLCRKHNITWRKERPSKSGEKMVNKTRFELIAELTENNHTLSRDDKKRRANLALKAGRYNIATTKKVMTNVTETWVGKPKGKLQVAWERGLLNLDKYCVEDYNEKGKLDDMGNIIEETSLDLLLSSCTDFIEEESLLQMNLRKMGATCFHSPKFHCELAGEGIEYSWGNAKAKYRKIQTKKKDTISKFHASVTECISRKHLNRVRVQKNSRRAREYMVAYFILSVQQNNNPAEENDAVNGVNLDQLAPCAVSAEKIEQMKQRVKTHRAAIDFDLAFCNATVKFANKLEK